MLCLTLLSTKLLTVQARPKVAKSLSPIICSVDVGGIPRELIENIEIYFHISTRHNIGHIEILGASLYNLLCDHPWIFVSGSQCIALKIPNVAQYQTHLLPWSLLNIALCLRPPYSYCTCAFILPATLAIMPICNHYILVVCGSCCGVGCVSIALWSKTRCAKFVVSRERGWMLTPLDWAFQKAFSLERGVAGHCTHTECAIR